MENRADSHIHSDTSLTMESRSYTYGRATGMPLPRPVALPVPSGDTLLQLRFFLGELTGLLFVILSTVYIFAVPVVLSRPGSLYMLVSRVAKRTLDIIGALTGMILCLPVWLIVPVLIKLDSSGPVFYSQTRVGVNRRRQGRRCFSSAEAMDRRERERRREDFLGKPFRVFKFRTMLQDAEKLSGPVWATKNDPRITRMGRFLRKTRLDEVPQFINILKGDMSLVGPRPERPHFVRDLSSKIDDYLSRLDVKPGLTGLAQVENGYDSSIASVAEKVRFDLHYIRTWSLWSDIKILAKTVVVVFTGKGAC